MKSLSGRLALFFAFAYVSHGISAQFGLIAQPIQYFMKGLGMTAAEVSSYLAIMLLPWALKPLYGLVFDFVPFLGYRRKSYLIAVNLMTAIALIVMSLSTSMPVIVGMFALTAMGMAASTALAVGLAVEQGRKDGNARQYFSGQTFWYYTAIIVASIGGGYLCQHLEPIRAVQVAATIAAVPVLVVSFLTAIMVREERTKFDMQRVRDTWIPLKQALRTRALWLVALFIFSWDFSPSFGIPLYFHETNNLHFTQSFIGQLAAWNAGGMVIGALLYRWFMKDRPVKQQLTIAITAGTLSVFGYLLLSTQSSAIALELCRGMSDMIMILSIYGLASDVCPRGTEVSVMAFLIAVHNLATEFSTFIGGQLFTHAFDNHFAPLVVVAAVTTGLCALLIPLMPQKQPSTDQSETS